MSTQRPDPIIDEVREIRRRISERFENDIDKLCDFLQELERQHPERLVRRNTDTGNLEPVVPTSEHINVAPSS